MSETKKTPIEERASLLNSRGVTRLRDTAKLVEMLGSVGQDIKARTHAAVSNSDDTNLPHGDEIPRIIHAAGKVEHAVRYVANRVVSKKIEAESSIIEQAVVKSVRDSFFMDKENLNLVFGKIFGQEYSLDSGFDFIRKEERQLVRMLGPVIDAIPDESKMYAAFEKLWQSRIIPNCEERQQSLDGALADIESKLRNALEAVEAYRASISAISPEAVAQSRGGKRVR